MCLCLTGEHDEVSDTSSLNLCSYRPTVFSQLSQHLNPPPCFAQSSSVLLPAELIPGLWDVSLLDLSKVGYFLSANSV